MVIIGTYVRITDNSGAKIVKCFHLLKKNTKKKSNILLGEMFKGSVKKHRPNKKVQKKQIVKVILITSKKKWKEKDGHIFWYRHTRGVVLNKKNLPIGTRVRSCISKKLKKKKIRKKWQKLRSISEGYC